MRTPTHRIFQLIRILFMVIAAVNLLPQQLYAISMLCIAFRLRIAEMRSGLMDSVNCLAIFFRMNFFRSNFYSSRAPAIRVTLHNYSMR